MHTSSPECGSRRGKGGPLIVGIGASAGQHSYKQWKDKCRGRISLWGGGVNSQVTLPMGTVQEVKTEVREVVRYLGNEDGFIFNSTHNITAEISPVKIIAMYKATAEAG